MARAKKAEPSGADAPTREVQNVVITAPNLQIVELLIEGTAPFVQLRFDRKTMEELLNKMAEEGNSKKGKKRTARDYDDEYIRAMYEGSNGERGIPASSFRNAMISACRIVGFKMTLAKLSIFVLADTFDAKDGTPLVKLLNGQPEKVQHAVRNATGVIDVRTRAMWRKWRAAVRIQYDADQFNATDIANLMARVGMQVGVGEGRPDGKQSAGMGWGLFKISNKRR